MKDMIISVYFIPSLYDDDFFFKERCINKLNTTAADNVLAVLDCVLDDRFNELKIRIPVSSSGLYLSFSKLVSIISRRSPALAGTTGG